MWKEVLTKHVHKIIIVFQSPRSTLEAVLLFNVFLFWKYDLPENSGVQFCSEHIDDSKGSGSSILPKYSNDCDNHRKVYG